MKLTIEKPFALSLHICTAAFRASNGVQRCIFLEFLKVKIELCVLNEVSNLI